MTHVLSVPDARLPGPVLLSFLLVAVVGKLDEQGVLAPRQLLFVEDTNNLLAHLLALQSADSRSNGQSLISSVYKFWTSIVNSNIKKIQASQIKC